MGLCATIKTNGWLLFGLLILAGSAAGCLVLVSKDSTTFAADNSFATLAGFVVLALVLERFCEAVLAPWWGTASAKSVKEAADDAPTAAALSPAVKDLLTSKRRLGVADAGAFSAEAALAKARAPTRTVDGRAAEAAQATADAANSAWVSATISRPTILLPAAGLASMACAALHLFLVHGIAKSGSGLPNTRIAFAADAVITGLALAGGAKPFHDLIESITPSK